MNLTPLQHKAFRELGMSKVFNKPMFKAEPHTLGYTHRARRSYDITLADDLGDNKARAMVLLHEIAHIFFGHMDENTPQELKDIKKLVQNMNVNYTKCMLFFGGPLAFLNIAMDLECNTKLMTKENNDYLNAFLQKELGPDTKICTPDVYETVEMDTFRDYYVPLVEYFKKHENEMKITFVNPNMGDIGISIDDVMAGLGDEDEIQKLIEESGYEGGNDKDDKNKNKSNSGSKNVEDEHDDIDSMPENQKDGEENKNKTNKKAPNAGKGRSSNNIDISESEPDKDIAAFLSKIVKTSIDYRQDAFRHYNRGTRRSKDGLLYNSLRRKTHSGSRILSIVTDVSGSIDTSQLATAVQSVKLALKKLHPASELATCDTDICDVYPITKIPNKLKCGGGTDMAVGLQYFVDKHAQDIVLYSDLGTDMNTVNKIVDKNPGINFYTIVTGRSPNIEDYADDEYHFLERNKRVLLLKN